MFQLSETDKAYIAGIVDGEGTISLSKTRQIKDYNCSYGIEFSITNTNKLLIDWLKAKIRLGRQGNKSRKSDKHKLGYDLVFRIEETEPLLRAILPYLVIKQTQAELVLEYIEKSQRNSKGEVKAYEMIVEHELIYQELLALNKRGT